MVFRNFKIMLVLRIIVLTAIAFLLVYLVQLPGHLVSSLLLAIVLLILVIDLTRYVDRTNRKLTQFLESIKHSDFSSSFSDPGLGKSFVRLSKAFNEVIIQFKETRAEKEEHYNYLLTVVQHINIAICAFRPDGKIDLFNNAFTRLFKKPVIRNIDELKHISPDLPETLFKMKSGDKHLCKIFIEDELQQLLVYATEFRMRGEELTLVSLQNISSELDEKEIESWQKLIRVLTHEIMNSITPISSLASTVNDMLVDKTDDKPALNELDEDDIESIDSALETIRMRSKGLLNFVEIYRNLTRIPKPNFRYFPVEDLFNRASQLLKPKMEKFKIDCSSQIKDQNLMLTADPDLIDQVVINLLLNAIDAVKDAEHPQIKIIAYSGNSGRIIIDFVDNGTGIKPDIMDKIFMPFFTSKKHGSGIGLSLSRQIMHLHKGTITVKSKQGQGTVFTLMF